MSEILVCAHPWRLIQATQTPIYGEVIPAIYQCPFCKISKSEGDPDPRVVIGRLEKDKED